MLVTNLSPGMINAGEKPLMQVTNLSPGIIYAGEKPQTRYHLCR